MSSILVLQHSDLCTPGRLGRVLTRSGRRMEIRRPDRDGPDAVPRDVREIAGVLSLGGPQNATDEHDWILAERELLRKAHAAGVGIVGICLGHQLLAAALGGRLGTMKTPEIGFHEITLLGPGREDPVLAGQLWKTRQFCSHEQEVIEVPKEAVVLAASERCAVQACRIGQRSYGFQYHFEWTQRMMEADTSQNTETLARCGLTRDSLAEQFEKYGTRFEEISTRLCEQLVSLVWSR